MKSWTLDNKKTGVQPDAQTVSAIAGEGKALDTTYSATLRRTSSQEAFERKYIKMRWIVMFKFTEYAARKTEFS